jgi:hypothetical protein
MTLLPGRPNPEWTKGAASELERVGPAGDAGIHRLFVQAGPTVAHLCMVQGRVVLHNMHSNDVDSPPPPPRVSSSCSSSSSSSASVRAFTIHLKCDPCSNVIQNMHSADVESPPTPPRLYQVSPFTLNAIHAPTSVRVVALNDTSAG